MQLKSLYLHNFRLYSEAFYEFSPCINVIIGPNASGKTTILEAIQFLAEGNSFRTHHSTHLIRQEAPNLYLEAHFVKHGIDQTIKISCSSKEKRIYVNSTRYPSHSGLIGLLLCVIFSPSDIDLIKGSPQGRRHYLDAQLSQADPLYLYHLNRYTRAMRQRNCLLKTKNISSIHSWEHEMALSAAYMHTQRLILLTELQADVSRIYDSIASEQVPLLLSYRCSGKLTSTHEAGLVHELLEMYERQRPREILMASTLLGPHKDDFMPSMGNQEMRLFASEGQMRSCAATLRLAEWRRLHATTGEKPLLLLDDVETSLDKNRSGNLLQQVRGLGQVFITSTEVPKAFALEGEDKVFILSKNAS